MYIKAKYLKNDVPAGRAYTFESEDEVNVGDKLSAGNAAVVVTEVAISEEEVAPYKDKIKKVQKVEEDN